MSQDHVARARTELELVIAALDGDSSAVARFQVEQDPNPVRLLACALAHTVNTLGAVVEEVAELRAEVDVLRRSKSGLFTR